MRIWQWEIWKFIWGKMRGKCWPVLSSPSCSSSSSSKSREGRGLACLRRDILMVGVVRSAATLSVTTCTALPDQERSRGTPHSTHCFSTDAPSWQTEEAWTSSVLEKFSGMPISILNFGRCCCGVGRDRSPEVEILLLVLSLHINMKYPPTTHTTLKGAPPALSSGPTELSRRQISLDREWTQYRYEISSEKAKDVQVRQPKRSDLRVVDAHNQLKYYTHTGIITERWELSKQPGEKSYVHSPCLSLSCLQPYLVREQSCAEAAFIAEALGRISSSMISYDMMTTTHHRRGITNDWTNNNNNHKRNNNLDQIFACIRPGKKSLWVWWNSGELMWNFETFWFWYSSGSSFIEWWLNWCMLMLSRYDDVDAKS